MADFNQPTNSSLYTDVLSTLNAKITSVAKMDFTGDTNVPTGSWRLASSTGLLETWSGTAWTIQGYMLKASATGTAQYSGAFQLLASSAPTWDTGTRFWFEGGFGTRYDGYQHRWDVGNTRTEGMRITQAGAVGFGGAPGVDLDLLRSVNANAIARIYNSNSGASATSCLFLGNNTDQFASQIYLMSGSHTAYGGANSLNFVHNLNAPMTWSVNGSERMRIDGSGRVGIGTITFGGSFDRLKVGDGAGLIYSVIDGASSGTGTGSALILRNGGTTIGGVGNYSSMLGGSYDGTPTFWSNTAGFKIIGIPSGAGTHAMKWNSSTGAWTYDTSSARYKEQIRDSVYGLRAVKALRSVQFEYKNDGRSDVGFIAEEVHEVVPELVTLNAEGQPDAVAYDRITSVLCKAIQELAARVEALEAQPAQP